MKKSIRIGAGAGYSGDRIEPAVELVEKGEIDYLVFECLAGTPPFGGRSVFEVGMAHLGDRPPDPCFGRDDTPAGLPRAVLAALAKRPEERPPSATAYAELLMEPG